MKRSARSTESKVGNNISEDRLICGDCLAHLPTMKADSIDLICTDPPYGIGFLNLKWDRFQRDRGKHSAGGRVASGHRERSTYQDWWTTVSHACLRVLKPGGFMFVVMTPRQDLLARAMIGIEDAGFVIGFTSLYWTYASGFPKAANIGKMIDRRSGAERAVIGTRALHDIRGGAYGTSRTLSILPVLGGAVTAAARRWKGRMAAFSPSPLSKSSWWR